MMKKNYRICDRAENLGEDDLAEQKGKMEITE